MGSKCRVLLTNHIVLYARLTYVEPYQNILEPFFHKNALLTIGLTDQSGYSICLLYGQTFHPQRMFQITSDYQYENISDWRVFKIGFRLVSYWYE